MGQRDRSGRRNPEGPTRSTGSVRLHRILAGVAAALAVGACARPVGAQHASGTEPYVGRWQCQYANYTVRNLMADNMTLEYVVDLRGDGTYYAQGSMFASVVGYAEPFESQGRWGLGPDGLTAEGMFYAGGYPYPFILGGKLAGQTINANGVGVAGRYAFQCQRAGG